MSSRVDLARERLRSLRVGNAVDDKLVRMVITVNIGPRRVVLPDKPDTNFIKELSPPDLTRTMYKTLDDILSHHSCTKFACGGSDVELRYSPEAHMYEVSQVFANHEDITTNDYLTRATELGSLLRFPVATYMLMVETFFERELNIPKDNRLEPLAVYRQCGGRVWVNEYVWYRFISVTGDFITTDVRAAIIADIRKLRYEKLKEVFTMSIVIEQYINSTTAEDILTARWLGLLATFATVWTDAVCGRLTDAGKPRRKKKRRGRK